MAQEIYHRSNWGNPTETWGNSYLNADLTNELYKRASEYENSWVTDQLLNGVGTKPSIILTPTAYEDGVLNSVKPKGGENLLTYSEDFSNVVWEYSGDVAIESGYTAPDGSNTAYKVTGTNAPLAINASATSTQTRSIYAKTLSGTGTVQLLAHNSNTNNTFTITPQWQRFEINNTTSSIGEMFFYAVDFRGASTTLSEVVLWGAQLERGSKATAYIPTNGTAYKNADFDFTRGSSATRVNEKGLVQDVQLLSGELVQNGDFEQIGSELVTNGSFDTDSDWSKDSGWSIENGQAVCDGVGINSLQQSGITTTGKIYKLTFDIISKSSDDFLIISTNFGDTYVNGSSTSLGTNTFYINTTSGTGIRFRVADGTTLTIDNVSVKEVGQNWTFGTGWSIAEINGNQVAEFDGGADAAIQQGSLLTSGKKYRLSIDVANKTTGSLQIRFGNTGVVDETITTNGTFTYDLVSDGTTLYLRSIAGFDGYIDNISVIEITDDTDLPRINYKDGEGSLLLEPQSTNLVTYSEDFSQWTIQSGTTVTSNTTETLSPSGEYNASKIVGNGTNGLFKAGVGTGGGTNTKSIYIKGTQSGQIVYLKDPNQTVNNKALTLTTDWQRYTLTESQTSAFGIWIKEIPTSGIYMWGGQVEALSYATSYIPTNGSTVTRLADVCNNSGNSDLFNDSEGVLYAEISALADDLTNRNIALSDNTTLNRILIVYTNTSNQIRFYLQGSGSAISINHTLTDETDFVKVAIKYKAQDFSFYVNGVEVDTNTSNITFSDLKDLSFYNPFGGGTSPFYGNVKCVAVFKEALSDTELQKLTTI